VATDLHNGDAVILRDGSLADAIRISMSIPAVYTPVERQGRLLVDGGIAANLPIDVARDLGADIIIAVDISDALLRKDEMQDTLSIMGQLTTLLTRRNMNQQLASLTDQDVLITPDLEGLGSADFDQVVALMENGATAARNAAVALNSLRVSDDAWAAYRAQRERATPAPPLISGVEIANHSRFSERFLRARVRQKPGQTLDREQLEADLRRIYGLGYFETVTYSLDVQEDETAELHIRAREKSWGPNYLRFGLGYEDNFDDDTHFNLAASYQMTGLNARGGELHNSVQLGTDPRLRTELFQPVSYGHRRFLLAGLEWSKQDASLFDAGGRVAEYKVEETRADLGWGVEIGTSAEIILGVRRGRVAL
ncbi:MAG: patatin-like phospholipase family protein, partial [Gammaproteobacteria bacterium]|nr:patatin-like phospholipase family protein [Gammaproteobacteria bacterium]